MKCPHLQGRYLQSCKASRDVYVPSQFEYEEYCRHGRHTMCPLYFRSLSERAVTYAAPGNKMLSRVG